MARYAATGDIRKGKYRNAWVIDGVTVEPKRFLLNDVIFPWESHPHSMRAWLYHDGGGRNGAVVWASHEQDAIDQLADDSLLDDALVDMKDVATEDDENGRYVTAGNASEYFDIQMSALIPIDFSDAPRQLIAALAEGRGAGFDSLDKF